MSDSDVRHKGKCTECEYFGRILKFQIFLGVCLIFFGKNQMLGRAYVAKKSRVTRAPMGMHYMCSSQIPII